MFNICGGINIDIVAVEARSFSMLAASDGAHGLDAGAIVAQLGITDGQMPARAATIHRLLDAAPPHVREQLLVLFFGELFS